MMILHAGRALLFNEKGIFNRPFYIMLVVTLVILFFVGLSALYHPFSSAPWLLPSLVFLTIFACQVAIIVMAHTAKFSAVNQFYLLGRGQVGSLLR
jgi:uncharacterized membrane protein